MFFASEEDKKVVKAKIGEIVAKEGGRKHKDKVKVAHELDKALHRSLTTGTVRYFTTGHEKRRELKMGYERPTQRWMSSLRLFERLRVETPVLGPPPLVLEVPRRERYPFSKVKYVEQIKTRFTRTLEFGMCEDLARQLNEQDFITRTALEKALKESEEAVKSMDMFLADQLKNNAAIETNLKSVLKAKHRVKLESDLVQKKMGDLKVQVFKRMEDIRQTLKCRDFLHRVAPPKWAIEYREKVAQRRSAVKPELERLNRLVDRYKVYMGGKDLETEKIFQEFVDIFATSGPTLLPFKSGSEIGEVMKRLERDNAELLKHIKRAEKPVTEAKDKENEVTEYFLGEINDVERILKEKKEQLENVISKQVMVDSILHDMMKDFRKSVVSEDVLTERALLQGLYEEVVPVQIPNPTQLQMWKGIDEAFTELRCKVNLLPKGEVERRRRLIRRQNKVVARKAEKARNRLREVEQMIFSLARANERPAPFKRNLRPRSEPPPAPVKSPPPPSPSGPDYSEYLAMERATITPLALKYSSELPPPISSLPVAHHRDHFHLAISAKVEEPPLDRTVPLPPPPRFKTPDLWPKEEEPEDPVPNVKKP